MRVIVCKDYNQMSEEAAKIISSQIVLKPNSVLGLATGTTPIGTYKRLIEMNKSGYLDFSKVKSSAKVYGNAKRYLTYALFELFKGEKTVKLSITHPGITFTNITAHYPKLIFAIIKHPMKIIFMKPRVAALSILKGVFTETEYKSWIGPRIFNIWGKPKKQILKTSKPEEIKRIAEISERVYEDYKKYCKNQ